MSSSTATTSTGAAPAPGNATQAGAAASSAGGEAKPSTGFTPITSQEALDHLVGERLARERTKFADYDDLKAKAEKLATLEDANKTAEQRTAEQLAALQQRVEESEKKAAAASQAALRASVANTKGVPEGLLPADGTREEMEAKADELTAWAKQNGGGGLGPGAAPTGGNGEGNGKSGGTAAGRELFEARHNKKTSTN